jgi:hypothetical protein
MGAVLSRRPRARLVAVSLSFAVAAAVLAPWACSGSQFTTTSGDASAEAGAGDASSADAGDGSVMDASCGPAANLACMADSRAVCGACCESKSAGGSLLFHDFIWNECACTANLCPQCGNTCGSRTQDEAGLAACDLCLNTLAARCLCPAWNNVADAMNCNGDCVTFGECTIGCVADH